MGTPIRRLAAVIPALVVALALGACAGGDGNKDVSALLDKAFKARVKSADLKLDAEIQLKGVQSLDHPIRIHATGPFRTNRDKLPSTNLDLTIGGGAQTVQTGFLSTGDRAFVKFQDVYYEQPRSQVERANQSLRARGGAKGPLGALGLRPHRWLRDARDKGSAKIAGADTTHISGKLDVSRLVQDLNALLRRGGGAITGATGELPKPLSEAELKKISDSVEDPSFDVYVAKGDNTIRRLSGHLQLKVPKGQSGAVGGLRGGSLSFTIEFSNVNGNQRIEAPANARPLSELTASLGTGGSGGAAAGAAPPAAGSSPNVDKFKKYAKCLDKANAQNTDALQRCADLLQ